MKLSGEALRAPGSRDNISPEIVARIAREIAEAQQKGNLQIAIVVGGGNIWRGARKGVGMNRARADHMGMLATVINALALQDAFLRHGIDAKVLSNRRPPYGIVGGLYDALKDTDGEVFAITNAAAKKAAELFEHIISGKKDVYYATNTEILL